MEKWWSENSLFFYNLDDERVGENGESLYRQGSVSVVVRSLNDAEKVVLWKRRRHFDFSTAFSLSLHRDPFTHIRKIYNINNSINWHLFISHSHHKVQYDNKSKIYIVFIQLSSIARLYGWYKNSLDTSRVLWRMCFPRLILMLSFLYAIEFDVRWRKRVKFRWEEVKSVQAKLKKTNWKPSRKHSTHLESHFPSISFKVFQYYFCSSLNNFSTWFSFCT